MRPGHPRALPLALALLALSATLLAAGCGGDGGGYGNRDGAGTAAAPTAAPNPEEGATFVSLASVPGLGLILVDSAGRTLYGFDADRDGEPSCYGECAATWPPLVTVGEPYPGNGAAAARLGTAERRDGAVQVTYAGHPLYAYSRDEGPGEATGDGASSFGGTWFALRSNGEPAG